MTAFRVYTVVGKDGYPPEWHRLLYDDLGIGVLTEREPGIKHLVRETAGHRCIRCGHPYSKGEGEWSACDRLCTHDGPYRWFSGEWKDGTLLSPEAIRLHRLNGTPVEAQWRILTVHHLDQDKANCRWWNLASLCQRCHLRVQRIVVMPRIWPWEHSDWFKPYVAGYYASVYLGEELEREQVEARLDELLGLERVA